MKKYHLTYHLVEGEETQAQRYCDEIRASQDAYARRKYPAHYTPYKIKDNYGKGKDWNGYICWYHYYTTI